MASNYNNNSYKGGCLGSVLIIMIILFFGCSNISLISGSLDEVASAFVIIADIVSIIAGIIISAIVSNNRASSKASSNQPSSQQLDRKSVSASVCETKNDKYNRRKSTYDKLDSLKSKYTRESLLAALSVVEYDVLDSLKSKYTLPDICYDIRSFDPLQKEMKEYQCAEVMQSVNKAINKRRYYAKKAKTIKEEIDEILACSDCSTDRERLEYLKSNEETLRQKKEEYVIASEKMKQVKIELMNKATGFYYKLDSALSAISSSKKSTSESGVELNKFMKFGASIPGDLFVSARRPIELNYGAYRFFLLPDVILAYDKANIFVTAFEPMALIITITNQEKIIYVHKNGNRWSYTDSIIASDSDLVSAGHTTISWLHERKNGGPDRRYSYNPKSETRYDTYAYSDFSVQIGRYKAEYSLSKGDLAEKLKPMVREYCSITHKFNAILSLLRLVESAAKKGEAVRKLSEQYENVSENIICRVKLGE